MPSHRVQHPLLRFPQAPHELLQVAPPACAQKSIGITSRNDGVWWCHGVTAIWCCSFFYVRVNGVIAMLSVPRALIIPHTPTHLRIQIVYLNHFLKKYQNHSLWRPGPLHEEQEVLCLETDRYNPIALHNMRGLHMHSDCRNNTNITSGRSLACHGLSFAHTSNVIHLAGKKCCKSCSPAQL